MKEGSVVGTVFTIIDRGSTSQSAFYIHIGPHKTGTKSIQWFLKENRTELLKRGYFVPESGNIHGGHHAIVRDFWGQELPEHQRSAVSNFARALAKTRFEAVILSSEPLDGLLRTEITSARSSIESENLISSKACLFRAEPIAIDQFALRASDQRLSLLRII